MKRVVTALLAVSVAVPGVLFLSSDVLFWLCLALFWGIAFEYAALGRKMARGVSQWVFLGVLPLVTVTWQIPDDGGLWALAALATAPLVYAVASFAGADDPRGAAVGLGWFSFGTHYLALPVWSIYELHRLDPRLLLLLLVSVWLNDTAAFYAGSRWGRHKLAPRLSPNKTIEGSAAGLIVATAVGWFGSRWLGTPDTWVFVTVVAVSAVAAQAGDLVESLLKRAADVKDSGRLLPGHGGLLDRMDAIILAAPVFYALFELLGL